MDFDLSDEQRLLKDSVTALLADRYSFESRKASLAAPDGVNPAVWQQMIDLGLTALPFAEENGGIGGGAQEIMIVMEAFGRALVVEPFFSHVILAGGAVRHSADTPARSQLIPAMIAADRRSALAHAERQSRYDLYFCETTAVKDGDGYVLDGAKTLVLHGNSAHTLIVLARTGGSSRDRSGLGLFPVAADAPGVSRRGYPTQDGQRAAEVTLERVRVPSTAALGDPAGALPVLERVAGDAIAAVCAEAVGCMDEMLRQTVEYMKTRKQFGATIGSFQALQHRASDMVVATEQARSMAMLAAMMVDEPNAAERAKALSSAKVQIGRSGKFVSQNAVQLFGGVGVTMEYAIGHYMKRLAMIETIFGDTDHHLGRLADGIC